jgi:HSP20 family protein
MLTGASQPLGWIASLLLNTRRMLPNATYYPDHSSIYPGEYEPLPGQEKELSDELKKSTGVMKPPVNVIGLHDYYRIEIQAPGFRREDFFINTNGEILSIAGMTKKRLKQGEESPGFHDLHYECIQRDIVLPSDVDTEFVTAEYANGILCVWLFRTSNPVENRPSQIIVY